MDQKTLDLLQDEHLREIGFNKRYVHKCKLKILMVTDGADFTPGDQLNLSELLDTLRSKQPFLDIKVSTAAHHSCRRGCDGDENTDRDFRFTQEINEYDEVWLFGVKHSGRPLEQVELDALANFMENGGGVFAAGDHDTIGFPLCGAIPRVRNMRRWSLEQSVPDMHVAPVDTLVGDEYHDAIPQTIYPRIYSSPYSWTFAPRFYPHPVLRGPFGPISVLPDHIHEGLVEVPQRLDERKFILNGTEVPEYPTFRDKPLPPEIIATATNQRNGLCFGAIGAFDGHLVNGRGRIIVDSTWHHFVNKNLIQFLCHYKRVQKAWKNGTTPEPRSLAAAKDYYQMRAYFMNIARWLARPATQQCLWWRLLCALRWNSIVQMVVRPEIPGNALPYFLGLGVAARQALGRVASDQEFWSLSKRIAEYVGLGGPFGPRPSELQTPRLSAVDPELVACVCVGGAIHALQPDVSPEIAENTSATEGFVLVRPGVSRALEVVCQDLADNVIDLEDALEAPRFVWKTTSAPAASSRYDDIWFVTAKMGWAVNNQGHILKTTNGGDSWEVQFSARLPPPSDRPVYLRCIGFANSMVGWVGTTTAEQRMYRTSDGGASWNAVDNLPEGNPNKVCGLYVADQNVIYASGTNNPADGAAILKSVDGGASWQAFDMSEYASNLIDIFFRDRDHGFVVGGFTSDPAPSYRNVKPVVLETKDGGATWTDRIADIRQEFPEGTWGWKIQFLNELLGFVSLENFTEAFVLKTIDGGTSWSRIDVEGNANLEGIGMISEQHGWVGGWGDETFSSGTSSVTEDGGASWRNADEIGRFINRFRFIGDPLKVGYACGRSVYKYERVPQAEPVVEAAAATAILGTTAEEVSFARLLPIEYEVPAEAERISIDVWDRFTNEVGRVLDIENPPAGRNIFEWDGTSEAGDAVPPGIYLYRITTDDVSEDRVISKRAPEDVPDWEQIRGYFRQTDRDCMCRLTGGSLDLWNCPSVLASAQQIYDQVKSGSMPPAGPRWTAQMVQDFFDWWKSKPTCPAGAEPTCQDVLGAPGGEEP